MAFHCHIVQHVINKGAVLWSQDSNRTKRIHRKSPKSPGDRAEVKGRCEQTSVRRNSDPKGQIHGDTHSAEAPLVGFIQDDDAVLAEKGVSQDVPQQAAVGHVPDGSVLKSDIQL